MPDRPTDHVNIDLTQFHLDAVRGNTGGRIIWQPRILAWLDDKLRDGRPLPDRYASMTLPENTVHCAAPTASTTSTLVWFPTKTRPCTSRRPKTTTAVWK